MGVKWLPQLLNEPGSSRDYPGKLDNSVGSYKCGP